MDVRGHSRRLTPLSLATITILALIAGACASTAADESRAVEAPSAAIMPTPLQDDANLHDVCLVGSRTGFAVGDRGVIWRTDDAGASWRLLPSGIDCALRSLCFLTDRVGWAVGGATLPYARVGVGALLATSDGGITWREIARGRLPQLHRVRFFSNDEGVVVGEATSGCPTGVFLTHDGGKNWLPVEGTRQSGWRCADFLAQEIGITAGLEGHVARFDEKLTNARAGGFGARTLNDVRFAGGDVAWLVGDGALVLRTTNRGVVWQAPPTPLPEDAAEIFDFRTVAVHGDNLWIAGAPGSVVWHSPDAGTTWLRQSTGQTVPIERLAFSSPTVGCAVGCLGSIVRTEDGGTTWQPARGGSRRAALLAVHSRASEVSFNTLAKFSQGQGYRSVVLLPLRRDEKADIETSREADLQLDEAVTAAGGSRGEIGWRFPLDIPAIDRDAEKLIDEWTRRTEGRFESAFYGHLVRQIRTWRPNVLIVERAAKEDAAASLLAGALLEAARRAADPTFFIAHRELADLSPWKVSRVYFRLPDGSHGDFAIDAGELVLGNKTTVADEAAAASSRCRSLESDLAERESFRWIAPLPDAASADKPRDFFTGLTIGSDARRAVRPIDGEFDEGARAQARRDRNLRAIIKRQLSSERGGAELLAELRQASRGTAPSAAARQLAMIADTYRANRKWDLAEAASVELVERFPREPVSLQAMEWLLQFWTGSEPTYQRWRTLGVDSARPQFDLQAVGDTIERAIAKSRIDPSQRDLIEQELGPDPIRLVQNTSQLHVGSHDSMSLKLGQQRDFALRMASLIRRTSPIVYRSADVQLPLAALLRQSGLTALPGEPTIGKNGSPPEAFTLLDRPTQKSVTCKTAAAPVVDGLLSDECWQDAVEIPLSTSATVATKGGPHAFAMLSRDATFLYFAFSVPCVDGVPVDGPLKYGRRSDEDLSPFDRLALFLDVDRDCTTWYRIEIDQRGCVAEACWGDWHWNPKMGIVAQRDNERWRIEGQIPFTELVARPPIAGEGWGLAVIRTVPAVRLESWSHPAGIRPRPESFGLLRFQ